MPYIGLDLGTTSITAILLETGTGDVLAKHSVSNDTETTSPDQKAAGRSEWDIDGMISKTIFLLKLVAADAPDHGTIEGIGVTGQQHGMVLLGHEGTPITPFIGWQDRRCHDPHQEGKTYLENMMALGGRGFTRSECSPARGYMGASLFWLSQNGMLPGSAVASFAPDYLVGRLCNKVPVTDPTNAAGSGLYDVIERRWNAELLSSLGIPQSVLPRVQASCSWAGKLCGNLASEIGIPAGTPVTNACGDNQASFAGSVSDYKYSVLVNIGTGGQISVYNPGSIRIEGFLVRPYLKSGYLLVGAGMTGGRSYAVLERFIRAVGQEIFGVEPIDGIYDRLNELASAVSAGSDDLICEPAFTGSLTEPDRRGRFSGINDMNLTPGHLARSLLEGMAMQFFRMYESMRYQGIAPRTLLVGAGNGVRKNPLLGPILSDTFGLALNVVKHGEEAAIGASLCAAVASKEFSDIEEAGSCCITYDTAD